MKYILIVEDDPAIADALQIMLAEFGYSVNTMHDGRLILQQDIGLPDLIILDKQLPGIDGLDLCRWLKANEDYKEIPVIVFSASPHIERLAEEAGADDAIEKPFKMEALRAMVVKHIG